MTKEEKARAYDKALKRAKEIERKYSHATDTYNEVIKIFPELAESEDERIYNLIYSSIKNDMSIGSPKNRELALAWLEKQKELPTNEEMLRTLRCEYEKGRADVIAEMEKQKEQKPISLNEHYNPDDYEVVMEGNVTGLRQKEQKFAECIEFDNEFNNQVSHLLASVLNGKYEYNEGFIKYAAQSLLGYAKNELKHAEWSEEDENYYSKLIKFLEINSHYVGNPKNERDLKEILLWLKSFKQEWSEEDNTRIERIASFVWKNRKGDTSEIYQQEQDVNWLKSLRSQQKSIISDTDKSNLKDAPTIIRKSNHPFKENIASIIEKYL